MVCIYCSSETQVINSRLQKRNNSVWRRRKCISCDAVYSTTETADYEKTWVVQYRGGSLAPFVRDKLFISIYKSCQHRPSALEDAVGLTSTVIAALRKNIQDGGLDASQVAKAAHEVLGRFDQPAAISYQAYHADVL